MAKPVAPHVRSETYKNVEKMERKFHEYQEAVRDGYSPDHIWDGRESRRRPEKHAKAIKDMQKKGWLVEE